MIAEKFPELNALSAEEKIILAGELWEELASSTDAFPPREDHIALLKERLSQHRQYPEEVIPWEAAKTRILSSK